jgi:methionyl-tRNA formyltransferase
MKRAVVFAYHNVGVRCLKVLAARGIDIALVVTHHDNPAETIWFESVAALCDEMGIPWIAPADPAAPELHAQVAAAQPDFIFSFYYRHMLPAAVLGLAPRGADNLHGSQLPKYRGRVPVNWAVLHGETETGATLHEMTAKPDAGAIIAQTMVPILPDDTAFEVFGKLTVASEQTLWQALPGLIAGNAPRLTNDLAQGSYFGGRKPEDGRIDWTRPAREIYNLHRAVAPPYPGAWTVLDGRTLVLGRARMAGGSYSGQAGLALHDGQLLGIGGDGRALRIVELLENGKALGLAELQGLLSSSAPEA